MYMYIHFLRMTFVVYHTGKCICRFAGINARVLPAIHRPDVVDIGVNTIYKNRPYAKGTIIEFGNFKREKSLFFKCIYYRAYSMVGIIIHLMCVKSLQLACN